MPKDRRVPRSFAIAAALALALSAARPAHAYLDPTTGGLLLQVILGGLAGVALALKLFWHRILGLLGIKKRE